jgi:hypothetical protein
MPDQTYEVEMHDGRKFRVVADHPPTEEEILAYLPPSAPPAKLMASHATPQDYSGALDTALGVMGKAGVVPGLPLSGPLGESAARSVGNPQNWPIVAGIAAAPFTEGLSIPAAAAASAGAGALGSVAKNAAEYFLGSKRAPATMADAAKDVATDAAVQGGAQAAGGILGLGLEKVAPRIMSAVLKPGAKLRAQNAGMDIPLEAVKQGAVVSPAGLEQQAARVAGLNQQVAGAIGASPATVTPSVAASPLASLLRERQALGPVAASDASKIQDALVNFVGNDTPMPIAKAQEIKKFLGAKVANKFGSPIMDPVSVDINQALRAGTKDAIAQAVPEVEALNQQLAPAIAVRKAIAARLPTTQNTNVVPARLFMAHNPIVSAISTLTGAPALASRGAGLMYRTGQTQIPGDAIRAALLQMMTGGDQPPQP